MEQDKYEFIEVSLIFFFHSGEIFYFFGKNSTTALK